MDYNACTTGLKMDIIVRVAEHRVLFMCSCNQDDGTGKLFKGYIRVSLNLTRPIKVANEDAIFARKALGTTNKITRTCVG